MPLLLKNHFDKFAEAREAVMENHTHTAAGNGKSQTFDFSPESRPVPEQKTS